MMLSLRAVFFDLDGTLTDITNREVYAIHDAANHFGLKISRARVKQLLDDIMTNRSSYEDIYKALGLALTDEVVEYWTSAFLERCSLSVLRPGAKSTLRALFGRYKLLCVTSRETLAEVESELEFLTLGKLFDNIVTREVAAKHFGLRSLPFVPFQEQRRKLYECALEMSGCHPNEVLVVGDMASELGPAKEMGITTVGLLTDKGKEADLRDVSDHLIPRIAHLRLFLDLK